MQKVEIEITMPEINSKKYKSHVKEIQESIKSINHFTNFLDQKVDNMLKGQETQFVNSYKNHMLKIELAVKQFQNKIQEYQKRIKYYENQGLMSSLFKKVAMLETQQKKLLSHVQNKDNTIKMLKNQNMMQGKQIKNLEERIKELMRNNLRHEDSNHKLKKQENVESIQTFSTQISPEISKKFINKVITEDRTYNKSVNLKYETIINPEDKDNYGKNHTKRLERQMETLKKRNRELSTYSSKVIQKTSEIEDFFIATINELKRKINVRKRFDQCTLEDFKQEDKLELLIKILSNEDVLTCLYEKIFKKKSAFEEAIELKHLGCHSSISSAFPNQILQDRKELENVKNTEKLRNRPIKKPYMADDKRFPSIISNRRESKREKNDF